MKLLAILLAITLHAQVTYDRLINSAKDPANWMTYSGRYSGWRYSGLDRINRENVKNLKMKWVYQMSTSHVETTPLVVDGVMYFTEPPSNVVAVDAETGREYWRYRRPMPPSRPRPHRASRNRWRRSYRPASTSTTAPRTA